MDKQKQIEEMEKDIAVRMAMAKGVAGSMNNGVEGWLSEYLYNAGYRKIPENAVVLMRNEAVGSPSYIRGYELGRKETAEKFAKRVKEVGRYYGNAYIIDKRIVTVSRIIEDAQIDEIAKEFTGGNNGGNT